MNSDQLVKDSMEGLQIRPGMDDVRIKGLVEYDPANPCPVEIVDPGEFPKIVGLSPNTNEF